MISRNPVSVREIKLMAPACSLGITDGSERGEYVPQSYLVSRLGRPHHVVNLMFQYYPDLMGWPTQGVKWRGFYRNNTWNKGDGYFPLVLEDDGAWGQVFLRQIEDVRSHGQEPLLTLTLHADTPDKDLVRIARALVPYAPMKIRINHECNGEWFYFNQRWSYRQISDFFIRFHDIIPEHAPGVRTVACWNGRAEAHGKALETLTPWGTLAENELGPMFKKADVVSYDQYASLHWAWPDPDFDPLHPTGFFQVPFEVWWLELEKTHRLMTELRSGEVDIEVHEINEDADVAGPAGQAEWIRRFYKEAAAGKYPWLKNLTYYQFRDRGGLGLEKEDTENPLVFQVQPSLDAYKEALRHPYFDLSVAVGQAMPASSELKTTWSGPASAIGYQIEYAIPHATGEVVMQFDGQDQLLVESGTEWKIVNPGTKRITFSHAAFGTDFVLRVFVLPRDGRNNLSGAFRSVLKNPPVPA